MMYLAWYTPIQNGISSVVNSVNGIWDTLTEISESIVSFARWIPTMYFASTHLWTFVPTPFVVVAVVTLVLYLIKILVGGDNN